MGLFLLPSLVLAKGGNIGIYGGEGYWLEVNTIDVNESNLYLSVGFGSESTDMPGYTWNDEYCGKVSLDTWGISGGYSYADLIEGVSIGVDAGYGSTNAVAGDCEEKDGTGGLMWRVVVDVSLEPYVNAPVNIGYRLMSIPLHEFKQSSGSVEKGGVDSFFGLSWQF